MNSCFAWDKNRVCIALDVKKCLGEKCKFYKTKEQIEKESKDAEKH